MKFYIFVSFNKRLCVTPSNYTKQAGRFGLSSVNLAFQVHGLHYFMSYQLNINRNNTTNYINFLAYGFTGPPSQVHPDSNSITYGISFQAKKGLSKNYLQISKLASSLLENTASVRDKAKITCLNGKGQRT